eukprot:7714331-Pyramimonas_sp.AAC.1
MGRKRTQLLEPVFRRSGAHHVQIMTKILLLVFAPDSGIFCLQSDRGGMMDGDVTATATS